MVQPYIRDALASASILYTVENCRHYIIFSLLTQNVHSFHEQAPLADQIYLCSYWVIKRQFYPRQFLSFKRQKDCEHLSCPSTQYLFLTNSMYKLTVHKLPTTTNDLPYNTTKRYQGKQKVMTTPGSTKYTTKYTITKG